MALFKRDKVWWMRYTRKGKQYRKSTGVSDKRTAERIYHKMMTQIAEGKWFDTLPGEKKTLRELLEKYIQVHAVRNKSLKSQQRDRYMARYLVDIMGDRVLTDITPRLVSQYKERRIADGLAPATINKELTLLGHAFKFAINEWEWVNTNPVSRVSKEKERSHVERWLSLDEEKRLLAVCPVWLKEIFTFAINTGFRRGEILNLKWHQVDLFRKTVTFMAHEQKNRDRDTLPLNKKALSVLKERARVRSVKTPLVFYSLAHTPIGGDNLRRAFLIACDRAGVHDFRFHDFRHTFATRLIQAGVDIYTVQKLGRWKSIKMVMRYAHHHPESLRKGVEVLDDDREKISTILAQSSDGADNGCP